ncbi:hypothetical protein, partial [Lacisediminimonas sp.]|uniref:hypothetical protein n=1 Tax=Lacisediminimonas sp. TaxID=3060582 RepID=UPI00271F8C66
FDDSSLFIVAGCLLKRNSHLYPNVSTIDSIDMEKFSKLLQCYGYKPFSEDYSASTIDPRTYIWLRHFIEAHVQAKKSSGTVPDMNLPCTWIQSLDEAIKIENSDCGGHVTPLYTNNVEGSVCANVLYALAIAIRSANSLNWFDERLQKIFDDTSNMIAWLIESETVNKRPDVVLLYYPDVEVFYYFVARILKQLRSFDAETLSLFPALENARNRLDKAMRKATIMLFDLANCSDEEGIIFWDGVLGKGRDRLFITATCMNALLDAWTVKNLDGQFQFLPDAPEELQKYLKRASNFLCMHATSEKYSFNNAVFSASAKSIWSYPERYPCNTFKFTDGTDFDPDSMSYDQLMDSIDSTRQCVLGVTGFVSDQDYQTMLSNKQFGLEQAIEMHPYTKISYWSVEDATRSMIILALAKYRLCHG